MATLTIPSVIQKYKEKVIVTKVKKMYALLSGAYEMAKIYNSSIGLIPYNEAGAIEAANLFKPYLKILKDCGTNDTSCYLNDNDKNYNTDPFYYKLLLNDGSLLIFRGGRNLRVVQYQFEIFYDINGSKAPNTWGYDLFEYDSVNDLLKPNGFDVDYKVTCPQKILNRGNDAWSCTAWVLYNENMDYLK